MQLEGITLAAVVSELRARAQGAFVQQVYEPLPELLILKLYRPATKEKLHLLISAGSDPRMHLTEQRYENPPEAPTFCMLLRKHLRGGTLERVEQPELERIIDLVVVQRGAICTLRAELMGNRSNVVLLCGPEVRGALKPSVGSRVFRPHGHYEPPPAPEKLDPRVCPLREWLAALRSQDAPLRRAIAAITAGIGPRTAQELCARAGLPPESPVSSLTEAQQERLGSETKALFQRVALEDFEPCLYRDEGGNPVDVTPFHYTVYGHLREERFSSISEALDAPHKGTHREPFEGLREAVARALRRRREKVEEALKKVARDLERAERHREYQELGDLLLAHLSELGTARGRASVELRDFEGQRRTVELDPQLTPVENAQRYYERAKKLRRGLEKLAGRRQELEWERHYLEEAKFHLEEARTMEELRELAGELGVREDIRPSRRKRPSEASRPRRFEVQGYGIWVGRSGRQNDRLVRESHREDWWLHVQDRPGAHVVVRGPKKGEEPPLEVLERAAELAAYYSKARGSGKAPVIATRIKYLRKPKGARPGLVLVSHVEKTLWVQPQNPFEEDGEA